MRPTPEPDPSPQAKAAPWLKRVSRFSAYALLAGFIVLLLSGWGITQTGVIYKLSFGLVDRRLANAIHRAVNAPVALFFILHVLINFRMGLTKRHPDKSRFIDGILVLFGGGMLATAIYMQYVRPGG